MIAYKDGSYRLHARDRASHSGRIKKREDSDGASGSEDGHGADSLLIMKCACYGVGSVLWYTFGERQYAT